MRGGRFSKHDQVLHGDDKILTLPSQFYIVLELGVLGYLPRALRRGIIFSVENSPVLSGNVVQRVYSQFIGEATGGFRAGFAASIIYATVEYKITFPELEEIPERYTNAFAQLDEDIRKIMQTEPIKKKLHYLQLRQPLLEEPYGFVLKYTTQGDSVRSLIAADFVTLYLKGRMSGDLFHHLVRETALCDHGLDMKEAIFQAIKRQDRNFNTARNKQGWIPARAIHLFYQAFGT
ncbi:hypothetical protein MMC25_000766 [Agyrium rufum]|nr:hypothetical protein [Agyrium rufum]